MGPANREGSLVSRIAEALTAVSSEPTRNVRRNIYECAHFWPKLRTTQEFCRKIFVYDAYLKKMEDTVDLCSVRTPIA